jgi:hypothetical protein
MGCAFETIRRPKQIELYYVIIDWSRISVSSPILISFEMQDASSNWNELARLGLAMLEGWLFLF